MKIYQYFNGRGKSFSESTTREIYAIRFAADDVSGQSNACGRDKRRTKVNSWDDRVFDIGFYRSTARAITTKTTIITVRLLLRKLRLSKFHKERYCGVYNTFFFFFLQSIDLRRLAACSQNRFVSVGEIRTKINNPIHARNGGVCAQGRAYERTENIIAHLCTVKKKFNKNYS